MSKVRESIPDVMNSDPYELLIEKKELEKKLKDKNTSFPEKIMLSGKILRVNQRIVQSDIGKIHL